VGTAGFQSGIFNKKQQQKNLPRFYLKIELVGTVCVRRVGNVLFFPGIGSVNESFQ